MREAGVADSALTAYLCGLSVECALRSLIPPAADFNDRHDVLVLAKLGALTVADDVAYARMGTLLSELTPLWKNSLRFYSRDLFVTFCRKRARSVGLHVPRGARPESVLSRRLLEITEQALLECERLWLK